MLDSKSFLFDLCDTDLALNAVEFDLIPEVHGAS